VPSGDAGATTPGSNGGAGAAGAGGAAGGGGGGGGPQRDLLLHPDQLPLLREEQEGLAELHQAQSQPQRVLRQSSPGGRRGAQGQLLDHS
jgi:hypothetical protein